MKKILIITLSIFTGLILFFYSILVLFENAYYESEIQEERDNIENSIHYNFNKYPKAFERIYQLSLNFPNIQQLRFFEDGRISFYVKHCQPKKDQNDYCFLLEINDTLQHEFKILNKDVLIGNFHNKDVHTSSWVIYFTAKLDHPNLAILLNQLGIDEKQLFELKEALDQANVDVHEYTLGYTKTNSMVVFGLYSLLASIDYIIPLSSTVDVNDYTKLSEHYYYGDAPTFRYFEPY